MNMFKPYLLRNANAGELLENFLVSAVASIIFIRIFLTLTGYPQLGVDGLHIAHMLWGGLLMLSSIVLVLSFARRNVLKIAAITGGIGFGTFIDELGKFITSDNNYFFQPTIALLYVLFIFLFFTFRFIQHSQPMSKKEYLINALQLLEDAVSNDLSSNEKKMLLNYLDKAHAGKILTKQLIAVAAEIKPSVTEKPGLITRLYKKLNHFFDRVVRSSYVKVVVLAIFIVQAVTAIIRVVFAMLNAYHVHSLIWGELGSSLLSTTFIILGLIISFRSKIKSYTYFRYAILTSILITQFFNFYNHQLNAFVGLLFNIFLLAHINYLIHQEKKIPLRSSSNL